jgi:hypothetical protein
MNNGSQKHSLQSSSGLVVRKRDTCDIACMHCAIEATESRIRKCQGSTETPEKQKSQVFLLERECLLQWYVDAENTRWMHGGAWSLPALLFFFSSCQASPGEELWPAPCDTLVATGM